MSWFRRLWNWLLRRNPEEHLTADKDFYTFYEEDFESDGAGTLTHSEQYEKWKWVESLATDDMSPKAYNALLLKEYGELGSDQRTRLVDILTNPKGEKYPHLKS